MDITMKRDTPPDTSVIEDNNKRQRTEHDDFDSLLNIDIEAFSILQDLLQDSTITETLPEKSPPTTETVTVPMSYVAFGGNEEFCGSCFSDNVASVMASFDFTGIGIVYGESGTENGGVLGKGSDEGRDYSDEFDMLLARFFGEDVCDN